MNFHQSLNNNTCLIVSWSVDVSQRAKSISGKMEENQNHKCYFHRKKKKESHYSHTLEAKSGQYQQLKTENWPVKDKVENKS